MELKLNEKIKAAVEVNGEVIINMENSQVYETIEKDEAFIYVKSILLPDPSTGESKEIEVKVRFLKK